MKKILSMKGFTLIELMVVIVIVGILAAVAIPKFTMAQHKAKVSEFPTVLTQIFTAEGAYEAENGSYLSVTSDFSQIGVTIPGSKFFSYTAQATSGSSYTATATLTKDVGQASTGDKGTINQDGVKGGDTNLLQYAPTWTNG